MTLSPRSFICVGTYEKGMIGLELTRNPTTNPQTEDDTLLYLSAPFSPQPHLGSVDTIAMCGSILATGCTDELIRLYDLGRMKEIGKCNEHSASLSAIALIERNQDKAMVSCDKSGVLYFWTSKKNGQEWNCQKGLELGHSYINELSVHPSAKMAIGLSSIDHCYHLINLQRGNIAQKVSVKRKEPLRHCLWADDGFTYILTCGKHFLLYDLRQQSDTGKEQPLIEGDLSFDVISLLFLDARTFVCGGEKGVWGIVCVKDGEGETPPSFSYHPLKTLSDRVKGISHILLPTDIPEMPDFTFSIAVGCSDGSVSVWLLAVDEDSVDGILVAFANIMTRLTCLCATHIDTVMEDDEIEEAPEPLPRKEKRQQSSKDEEKTVERSQANDDSSKAAKNGEKKKRKRQPKLSVSKHE